MAGYISFVNNDDATLMLDSHIERSAFDALYQTYLPRYVWAPKEFASPKGAENIFCEKDYILWEIMSNESPVSDKLSVLLTTSGSTGSPKLVRLSKENLMSNALSIVEYLNITANERPVIRSANVLFLWSLNHQFSCLSGCNSSVDLLHHM